MATINVSLPQEMKLWAERQIADGNFEISARIDLKQGTGLLLNI